MKFKNLRSDSQWPLSSRVALAVSGAILLSSSQSSAGCPQNLPISPLVKQMVKDLTNTLNKIAQEETHAIADLNKEKSYSPAEVPDSLLQDFYTTAHQINDDLYTAGIERANLKMSFNPSEHPDLQAIYEQLSSRLDDETTVYIQAGIKDYENPEQ